MRTNDDIKTNLSNNKAVTGMTHDMHQMIYYIYLFILNCLLYLF